MKNTISKTFISCMIILNNISIISSFPVLPTLTRFRQYNTPTVSLLMSKKEKEGIDIFNDFIYKKNNTNTKNDIEKMYILSEIDKTLIRIYMYAVLWYYCIIKLLS